MFFFASDNRLAPLLVSELKAIKDAGFQEHTEVVVYYDPLEKGCPTKIYNVNTQRKADALAEDCPTSVIGDGNDSYVRNMDEDEVDAKHFSVTMRKAMANSSTVPAHKMLGHFVDYVTTKHKARNYMLFLIGHGMIVGRDIFLPDDDPVSAVSMAQLQKIMKKFVHGGETRLQLLAMHSCSMSSIEVAYQLRGTANYMIAHQGPAFVNSWNYRQVLKKILNTIDDEKRQIDVEKLIEKLYYHCLHNATDFLSAGYSADLALYSLQEKKLSKIRRPLQLLVKRLKDNLPGRNLIKDLILLAHWEAQSFWEENYTDLYDFCFCLRRKCDNALALYGKKGRLASRLRQVKAACEGVTDVLSIIESDNRADRFGGLVIHAGNFGTKYQYARGLSIYFPWCEPLDDEPWTSERKNGQSRSKPKGRNKEIIEGYKSYDFNKGGYSWWSFLNAYFKETKRESAREENRQEFLDQLRRHKFTNRRARRFFNQAASEFNVDGSLGTRTPDVGTRTPDTGLDCTCPTIKNYPTVEKTYTTAEKKSRTARKKSRTATKKRLTRKVREFSITPDALRAFRPDVTEDDDTPW
jgi:hypothetical protein